MTNSDHVDRKSQCLKLCVAKDRRERKDEGVNQGKEVTDNTDNEIWSYIKLYVSEGVSS